ncbi:hypothetical protein CC2G_004801 [Coprinopsis cinerea AmutBmut pab1-1]|nr:hypothetical protein CC2G_004801 [Coprinopsis cinerea AmutBmut pab1-1]
MPHVLTGTPHTSWSLPTPITLLSLILLLQMIQPTISVPLLQFDASQAVLEAYIDAHTLDGTSTVSQSVKSNQKPNTVDPTSHRPLPHPKPVGLPVSNPTKSFWTHGSPDANPLAREGSQGELTPEADVCIIGSGITGVSALWHLVDGLGANSSGRAVDIDTAGNRNQKKVVVLEARDFCSGATGRNGGHLTPFIFFDFSRREQLYGTSEALKSYELENYTSKKLVGLLNNTGDHDDADLVNGGHITLFLTDQEERIARKDFEAAKAAGLSGLDKVVWIDKDEMNQTKGTPFPGVQIPGHNLWPLKLVTKMFKLAEKKAKDAGVDIKLHTHTPVTGITPTGSQPESSSSRRFELSTPRGPIKCSYIIHATNGYANHLLSPGKTGIVVVPTRGQIIGTRAAAGEKAVGKTSWDANEGFEYWFPRPVKEEDEKKPLIILGGGREVSAPNYELYETNDAEVNHTVGSRLKKFLPGLFPGMFPEESEPEWEWTGITGFTKTGDPFVSGLTSLNDAN